MMSYSHIILEAGADGVAVVTVNRPDKLNALSTAVILELKDAFERIASEPSIRAAIVTGAGQKAFVAGADIAELESLSAAEARAFALRGQRVLRLLESGGKPSVAAVNGYALGGGLELAMACTVRFASENARLGQPEVKLGIVPGYGGTQRLPRLVGRGRALEMLLSGEPVTAAEAHRIGLVNAVTPQAELLPRLAGQGVGKRTAGGGLDYGSGRCRPGCGPGSWFAPGSSGVRLKRRHRGPARGNTGISGKAFPRFCRKVSVESTHAKNF
jgi:enoyl-CoA hydratase